MRKLRCWFGLCMKPTGYWRFDDRWDYGTIYTCECGRREEVRGDRTGFPKGEGQ